MKQLLSILMVLMFSVTTYAQDKHDQIRSLKVAHITAELNLSSEQAEKFLPIYIAYDKKMSELRHTNVFKYIKNADIQDLNKLSDKEANKKVQELIDFEESYSSARIKFVEDVKKIIGEKKILVLKKAEDDFNRQLLKKYKDKK
ncbi:MULTISPECIES: hypothetical protein [Myroides]|uniref:Sensor of ECF-type sigma factor n=2 Tax=Myroides odoratimimus TaxID=76832 RepID=A0AAI8C956_9FLAO|nr:MULTISPECIES: hypothetical protein [Myroides]AJA69393.1 hypothetical protein MYRA21_2267 [Myroides sp. A21]ALU28344.1 hypothetical protein AS202_11075 [Myroides odoratimimus]APA92668.1 hypothetical protein BK054_10675 [Myroides sp. ZB35]EHO13630.1 hypothetical protein HMPREF9715_01168 [Myroides odoratimimus CIP 101113]EKB03429.1 hypothetical protein HMPREF9711_02756 [Myroides odoratimimus CCUG 3837]